MLYCMNLIEMFQLHFPFQIKFTTPFVPCKHSNFILRYCGVSGIRPNWLYKEEKIRSVTLKKIPPNDLQTFGDLGLVDVLVEACERVGWKKPSRIQEEAIPVALQVRGTPPPHPLLLLSALKVFLK
jgi:hypothetical protein